MPSLSASPNAISAGNSVSLVVTGSRAFTVTSWLTLASFTNQSATTQSIIVNTPQTFAVTGKTADECPHTTQVSVTLTSTEDIYIPNTLPSDNNCENDVFKVYGTGDNNLEIMMLYEEMYDEAISSARKCILISVSRLLHFVRNDREMYAVIAGRYDEAIRSTRKCILILVNRLLQYVRNDGKCTPSLRGGTTKQSALQENVY